MSGSRFVAIRGLGAVGAFGVGRRAFERWWEDGRPSCRRPPAGEGDSILPIPRVADVPGKAFARTAAGADADPSGPGRRYGWVALKEAWDDDDRLPDQPGEERGVFVGGGTPPPLGPALDSILSRSVDGVLARADVVGALRDRDLAGRLLRAGGDLLPRGMRHIGGTGPHGRIECGAAGALEAVAAASREISAGRLDRALAGAADSLLVEDELLAMAAQGAFRRRRGSRFVPGEGACFVRLEPGQSGDLGVLGSASAFAPIDGDESPDGRFLPPPSVEAALSRATEAAWASVPDAARTWEGEPPEPEFVLRGPRLPWGGGDVDLWRPLGDPGAAAGALLLAAAVAAHTLDELSGWMELAAAGPRGEAVVLILGPIP